MSVENFQTSVDLALFAITLMAATHVDAQPDLRSRTEAVLVDLIFVGSFDHCQEIICFNNYTDTRIYLVLDIDECRADVCPVNSLCANTQGSYRCLCERGYAENMNVCEGT